MKESTNAFMTNKNFKGNDPELQSSIFKINKEPNHRPGLNIGEQFSK